MLIETIFGGAWLILKLVATLVAQLGLCAAIGILLWMVLEAIDHAF